MSLKYRQKAALVLYLSAEQERRERQDLIAAQHAQRLAPRGATRPLLDHEIGAAVYFAELDDDVELAVLEATNLLEALHADIKAMVLVSLFGENREPRTPEEAQEVIRQLAQNEPPEITEAESNVALLLAGVLAGAYLLGGRRVIQEAARQGVPAAQEPGGIPAARLAADAFSGQGAAVAQHPWRRIMGRVEREVSSQSTLLLPLVTPDLIGGVLDQIEIAGSVDEARQAISTSAGRGRLDTVETAEALAPQRIWASEIMDGEACDRCDLIDGREFDDLAMARDFYPDGYFYRCRGGPRCRGTLIFRF